MGTIIVGMLLLSVVGLIVCNMVKSKRQGKSIQCGCDCSNCHGNCH